MITTTPALPQTNSKGGRSTTRRPQTPLGQFLLAQIQERHLIRSHIAKHLGIKPYHITRLLYDDTPKLLQRWPIDEIIEAFQMNEITRRNFLKLLGKTGLTILTISGNSTWTGITQSALTPDLAMTHDLAQSLELLIEQAPQQVQFVKTKAKQWYETLQASPLARKEPRIAQAQIRFGMLFARAQEMTEPWYRRPAICIRTYSAIEEMILRFPPGTFPNEYARVFERRAPLYRQIGQFEQGWQEFTWGIGEIEHEDRENFLFTLYRNRAHIHAQQGQEQGWRKDLEIANHLADRLHGESRHLFLDLASYSEGEGYKTLARTKRLDLPIQKRVEYARKALDAFAAARQTTHLHWRGHLLMIEMAEAECLMWLDMHEAYERLLQIQPVAQICLPSLLLKIQRAQAIIEKKIGGNWR